MVETIQGQQHFCCYATKVRDYSSDDSFLNPPRSRSTGHYRDITLWNRCLFVWQLYRGPFLDFNPRVMVFFCLYIVTLGTMHGLPVVVLQNVNFVDLATAGAGSATDESFQATIPSCLNTASTSGSLPRKAINRSIASSEPPFSRIVARNFSPV